jgi:hypothetical protein
LRVRAMADPRKAESALRRALASAPTVPVTVDLVKLPGRATMAPYEPHLVTVAAAGDALVVEGLPRGRTTMTWSELVGARWTGATKYGGLHEVGSPTGEVDVRSELCAAIRRTADCLLEPSATRFDGSFGVPGMRRWARLLTDPKDKKGWPRLFPDRHALDEALAAVVRGLRAAGTCGGASRRLYPAFLDESASLLDEPSLAACADAYRDLSDRWTDLIALADRPDCTPAELAGELPALADMEQAAALSLRIATTAPTKGAQR